MSSIEEIRIKYSTLYSVAAKSSVMLTTIDSIRESIKVIKDKLETSEANAIMKLSEKYVINEQVMDELYVMLKGINENFGRYSREMGDIVSFEKGTDDLLVVRRLDAGSKIGDIIKTIDEIDASTLRGLRSNNIEPWLSFGWISEEDKSYVRKLEGKIDKIEELIANKHNHISVYIEDLSGYLKTLLEFQEKDSEIGDILKKLYDDLDIAWYETSLFKIVVGGVVLAGALVVVINAPAFSIIAVNVAKEVIVSGVVKATSEGAVAFIKGEDVFEAVATGLVEGEIDGVINALKPDFKLENILGSEKDPVKDFIYDISTDALKDGFLSIFDNDNKEPSEAMTESIKKNLNKFAIGQIASGYMDICGSKDGFGTNTKEIKFTITNMFSFLASGKEDGIEFMFEKTLDKTAETVTENIAEGVVNSVLSNIN